MKVPSIESVPEDSLVLPERGDIEVDVLPRLPAEPQVDRPSAGDPPTWEIAEEINGVARREAGLHRG